MSLHQMPGNILRGRTYDREPTQLGKGTFVLFPDNNPVTRENFTNVQVIWQIVKNTSGAPALPGLLCDWQAGKIHQEIGGAPAADTPPAGIIDPFLPAAGAPNGNWLLIITKGPGLVVGDGTATQNNAIGVAAGGQVKLNGLSTVDLLRSHIGYADAADPGGGALFRVDFRSPQRNY